MSIAWIGFRLFLVCRDRAGRSVRTQRHHILKLSGMTEGQDASPAESIHAREDLIPGVMRQPLCQLIDRARPSAFQTLKDRGLDLAKLCHINPPTHCMHVGTVFVNIVSGPHLSTLL